MRLRIFGQVALVLLVWMAAIAAGPRTPEKEQSKSRTVLAAGAPAPTAVDTSGGERPVMVMEINGPISPATDDYLRSALADAERQNARVLVLRLNTPGGLLASTKSMVEQILDSPVPIIIYVSPAGGSATSAGVFLTLAGHVAAMAPGTTIGAAHPVTQGGDDIDGDMREKVENFAVSMMRAIAEQRGRNVRWAEQAVRESVSITDSEAVTEKVVDFAASDIEMLLGKAEGRTVTVRGKPITLANLATASRVSHPMNLKQKLLTVLCDPNIAILLGLAAMLGIGIELYHPGAVLPGIVGVTCLVLSLVAAQVLPINYGGAVLLALGVLFFVIETFLPSFGIWGISGVICFVLGSMYFIDGDKIWAADEWLRVDIWMVGISAAVIGAFFILIGFIALRARRRRVTAGPEGLIGEIGVVKSDFASAGGDGAFVGKVFILGEYWNARTQLAGRELDGAPRVGDKVKVTALEEGMTLLVERIVERK